MYVHCPECDAAIALEQEMVDAGVPKIRCNQCSVRFRVAPGGTTIVLSGNPSGGTLPVGLQPGSEGAAGAAGTPNAPQLPANFAAPNLTGHIADPASGPAKAAGASPRLLDVPELDIGRHFRGKYRIDAVIGRGGSATVYRVHDIDAEIDRALKVVGAVGGGTDGIRRTWAEEYKARLKVADGTHLLSLESPLVEEIEGTTYVALPQELGQSTLREWLEDKKNTIAEHRDEALRLFAQVCRGVEALHQRGLAHLDLKPENVLLFDHGGQWTAKVGDFGLARATGSLSRREGTGTPAYMAPEQVRSAREKDIGPWSDIYALGCMLFELLDGEAPFSGTAEELKDKQLNMAPSELDGAPPHLKKMAMACLAKARRDRPSRAVDLVEHVSLGMGRSAEDITADSKSALVDIRVPELPEGTNGAQILSWQAAIGQQLTLGDQVLEIEADTVVIQVKAIANGILRKTFKQEGDTVSEGRILGQIECRVLDRPPFDEGDIVKGIVDKIMDFGAFVEFDSSNFALVHISEVSSPAPNEVTDFLEEGLHAYVRIIEIDGEGRVRASMLGVSQPPRFIEPEAPEAKFLNEGDIVAAVVEKVYEYKSSFSNSARFIVHIRASAGNVGVLYVNKSDSALTQEVNNALRLGEAIDVKVIEVDRKGKFRAAIASRGSS